MLGVVVSLLSLRSEESVGRFGKARVYSPMDHVISLGADACLLHCIALTSLFERDEHTSLLLPTMAILASFAASTLQRCTLIEVLRRFLLLPYLSSWFGVLVWSIVMAYHIHFGFGAFPLPTIAPKQVKPKKVLFVCIGTRGDVQPFIHLGKEMKLRGHEVAVCALEPYGKLVCSQDITFYSAGRENLEDTQFWRTCLHVSQVMNIPDFAAHLLEIGLALHNAVNAFQPDCIVCTSTAQSLSFTVADTQQHKRPVVICAKFAPDHPTRAFSAPGYDERFRFVSILTWYHHWLLIAWAANRVGMGKAEAVLRSQLGLAELRGGKRLKEMADCPTLCVFSPHVLERHADWSTSVVCTGWWQQQQQQPEQNETVHFSKQKTVCITFGSMTLTAQEIGLIDLLLDATVDFNVVLVGSKFQQEDFDPNRIQVLNEANYSELFPNVFCVIHHAGAGTTASCISSAAPSIAIPILLWTDQPMWAQRIQQLGLGYAVEQRLAFKLEGERERVTGAIQCALKHIQQTRDWHKLIRMSDCVRSENGLLLAAQAIESYCVL